MNSQRIKFANEFCFTAILEGAESLIELGIVDYQIPQDDLFVKQMNGEFVRMAIAKEENTVISQLRLSYGRALLRIDIIDDGYVSFTLLEFSDVFTFDEENPLRIIVDQAIFADLKANNIEIEKAVEEIKRQLIVDENGKHVFAYSMNNESGDLELVGDKYSFKITKSPQYYLHIIQIRRRTNKSRIDFPIVLVNGCIEIVNELTDRAILTARADEQYAKLISSDAEFINLWKVYNELELESIKQQAAEMGFLKYKEFRYSNGMVIFLLDSGYTRREFCADNMYYVAINNIDTANPMDYSFKLATVIGTEIDYSCINTTEFRIKEEMDTTRIIPSKGYLLPSISGSAIQSRRRKQAESNILSNKCKMPGLKNIIQEIGRASCRERVY